MVICYSVFPYVSTHQSFLPQCVQVKSRVFGVCLAQNISRIAGLNLAPQFGQIYSVFL